MTALPENITRPEIRARLTAFASRWDLRPGNEQQEAQQFLLELMRCYGLDTEQIPPPFTFEHRYPDGTRADLLWPGFLLVEMKSASESHHLELHRAQVLRYWGMSADPQREIPSPRWLILCSFRRLEVWQPGEYPGAPRAIIDLIDLPERLETLQFLRGDDADFARDAADLAGEAVEATAAVYRGSVAKGGDPLVARNFILQSTWCMFAEDLELLPDDNFTRAVESVRRQGLSTFDQLGDLFEWLNRAGDRPDGGMFRDVPYANGGLFARPARIDLEPDEVELLHRACTADWALVEPSIFGGLLQSSLGIDRRRRMSAFYTPEAEIEKIVGPTIVGPWEQRIASIDSAAEAIKALTDLASFRVLDPACGCGNFLYVAYRELRRLEAVLRHRLELMSREEGRAVPDELPSFSVSNMLGIEKDPFAAALAQVVLWIGHKRATDLYRLADPVLPLPTLGGIVQGDALTGEWPTCDAVVGNPPFHGTKRMRQILGEEELEFLRREFGVGITDYCVYWFLKAHRHLKAGQRAGLVATNSIAEGKNREASLDHIVDGGGVISDAVRSQPWPGEANVHVSIINWVKRPKAKPGAMLDGVPVSGITSELAPGTERPSDAPLKANRGRQFFGVVVGAGGDGFVLAPEQGDRLRARDDADYGEVVRPYLIGNDITTDPRARPTRWVVDFGERSLEEAGRWPAALDIVRRSVKPARDSHPKQREREQWWKHSRSVRDLFAAIAPLPRFIACPATSKRVMMVWCEPQWCLSNAASAFAFADDYSFGVLQSRVHTVWAVDRSTKLKSDPRYTSRSFVSFPWPAATAEDRVAIGAVAVELATLRAQICVDAQIGLTALYNAVDEGAYADLAALHRRLDTAVWGAYGWPADTLDDSEIVTRLATLNASISAGETSYAPFALTSGGDSDELAGIP